MQTIFCVDQNNIISLKVSYQLPGLVSKQLDFYNVHSTKIFTKFAVYFKMGQEIMTNFSIKYTIKVSKNTQFNSPSVNEYYI